MTIDELLPHHDTATAQAVVVEADAPATYAAIAITDLAGSRLARTLSGVSMAPERLAARLRGKPAPLHGHAVLADLTTGASPWTLLAERDGRELVLGLLWTPPAGGDKRPAAEFAGFDAPGFVKVAWSLSVVPYGPGRSVLVTETRAVATDDATRRRYVALWRVIAPFAGLLRREVLLAIRAEAEAAGSTAPKPAIARAIAGLG